MTPTPGIHAAFESKTNSAEASTQWVRSKISPFSFRANRGRDVRLCRNGYVGISIAAVHAGVEHAGSDSRSQDESVVDCGVPLVAVPR